jgi:hypothetical protein
MVRQMDQQAIETVRGCLNNVISNLRFFRIEEF